MINRVVLIGRLTKDLELKHTQTNIPNLRFTLAANRPFLNQNGDKEADYINCIAWKKQAENMAKHLRKGSLIAVEGRIQTSNFEGQDGKRVYMTEVVAESVQFLDPRSSQQDTSSQQQQPSQQSQQQTNQQQQQQPVYQQSYQQPSQQQQQYAGGVGGQPSHNWEPNRIGDVSDDDLPF